MDHEAVRHELHTIYSTHGVCTPALVVEAATDPSSPLHPHFTWDDAEAATARRLDEARHLIRTVKIWIERPEGPKQTRAMVNVTAGPTGERTYAPVMDAMADPAMRQQVLAQAFRELQAFRRKYSDLEELASVLAVIDQEAAA